MGQPPSHPPQTGLERSVSYLITALANKFTAGSSRRLKARLGVGLMEWRVIALLGLEAQASPARIAQVAGVDKSVVSRAVNALVARGQVAVSSAGQMGRQTQLTLTPAGLRVHREGMVHVLKSEERLLDGFSADERDQLIDFLKRLTANLPKLD